MTKQVGPGRPTVMTQEKKDYICAQLAEGRSLRSICSEPDMPHVSTVLLHVVNNTDGFFEQYRSAREAAGHAHADNLVETANLVRAGELGANEARAINDALKWAAERMAPKSFSPRQEVDHTTKGESLNRPATELTDDELARIASGGS